MVHQDQKARPPAKLVWGDPPESKGRKGSMWDPVAKALKNRPGQWALIGTNIPTGIVSVINRGELKCFRPKGHFECVTRNHTERWVADVYARYVGEEDVTTP